jgi:dynein assembly factor 1, axonemal
MAGIEMTSALLKKYCKDNGLYSTPSINDKIYLHYKGFRCIQNLDEYVNLKCIWLEGNGLSRIEGLDKLTILRTIFLQENIIEKIENLDYQLELDTLNLSKNYIKKIENLSHLKELTSLNLSHNQLTSAADIKQLAELEAIQTIDVQYNKIVDTEIVEILSSLPDLRVLYLIGNPVIKSIKHYRKTLISKCKALKYLDDRPVFDDERRRVEAWMKVYEVDGNTEAANEAERNELSKIRKEKDDADERNFRAFEELMRQGAIIKSKRESDEISDTTAEINPFSGEAIVEVPESSLLREAREQRWGADVAAPSLGTVTAPTSAPTSALVENLDPQTNDALPASDTEIAQVAVENTNSGWMKLKIVDSSACEIPTPSAIAVETPTTATAITVETPATATVTAITVETPATATVTAITVDAPVPPIATKKRFASLLMQASIEVASEVKVTAPKLQALETPTEAPLEQSADPVETNLTELD